MFEAGRTAALAEVGRRETQAVRSPSVRVLRLWQTAATFMTAVSLILATTLTLRTDPEPRVIIVDRLPPPATTPLSNQTTPGTQLAQDRQTPPATAPATSNRSTTRKFPQSDDLTEFFTAGSFMQRAHELALASSLDAQHNVAETPSVKSNSPSKRAPMEPPLSPLSLMGHKPHLTIDRLLEEHPL